MPVGKFLLIQSVLLFYCICSPQIIKRADNIHQLFFAYMQIPLGCFNVEMAKQFFFIFYIRTIILKMCSKAICLFPISFHYCINRKASASVRQLHKDSKAGVWKMFLQTWNRKFQSWKDNFLTGKSHFLTGKSIS